MKFTGALSTLLILLPIAVQAAPGAMQARNNGFGFQKGGFGGKGGNQNQNKGGNNAGKGGNQAGNAAAGAANNGTAAAGGNNNNNNAGNAGNAGGNNPQTSLTLDPSVICTNCAQNGQAANGTEAGQVASATSTNNFINFCVGKTITNGQQVQTGSCNPIPMGNIPAKTNQVAAKFSFPTNMANIGANTAFTIKMNIQNLQTGAFVNPQTNYFAAPQNLNNQGIIIGHSHVTVQAINGVTDTQPVDPQKFAFFQGLNAAAQGGVLTSDVAKGLDAGTYRLCSINTDANHTPVLGPVAQKGTHDDCVYFTVGAAAQQQALKDIGAAGAATGNNNANAGAAAANNSTAAAGAGAAAGAAAGAGAANGGKGQTGQGAKTGAQGGAKTGQQSGTAAASGGKAQASQGAKTGAQGGAKTGQQSGTAAGGKAQTGQQQGAAANGQQQSGAKQGQQQPKGKNGRRFNISRQN